MYVGLVASQACAKAESPSPWETQRYEAREAWGLPSRVRTRACPRTLDPGPHVDGSAAWMGHGRLTWERWDEQVVERGGSALRQG